MILTTEEMARIYVEVGTGKSPAKNDTPAMARYREQTRRTWEEARRKGWELYVPGEMPQP